MADPSPSAKPAAPWVPRLLFFLTAAGLLAIDQGSKEWAQRVLVQHGSLPLIDGWFKLTYVRNTGAAFGVGADQSAWLFLLLTPAIVAAGLWWSRSLDWRLAEVNLVAGALVGGALGNWIDRLRYGYVVDFFDFTSIGYPWVFNVADSAIVISVAWIFLRQAGFASRLPNPNLNAAAPLDSPHARHQSHPTEPR
jgi:signal peptidase II